MDNGGGEDVNKLQTKGLETAEESMTIPDSVSVSRLRFTQDSIAVRFSSGQRIDDTVKELVSGTLLPEAFPPLVVFPYNSHLWCLSNRRLWVFCHAKGATVRVVAASLKDYRSWRLRKLLTNEVLMRDLAKPDYLPQVHGSVNLDFKQQHGAGIIDGNKFATDGESYENANRFEEASPTVSVFEKKGNGGTCSTERAATPASYCPQTCPSEERVGPRGIDWFLGQISAVLQWLFHKLLALCYFFFSLDLGYWLFPQTLPPWCYRLCSQLTDNWLLHRIRAISSSLLHQIGVVINWLWPIIVDYGLPLLSVFIFCWIFHEIIVVSYWLLRRIMAVCYRTLLNKLEVWLFLMGLTMVAGYLHLPQIMALNYWLWPKIVVCVPSLLATASTCCLVFIIGAVSSWLLHHIMVVGHWLLVRIVAADLWLSPKVADVWSLYATVAVGLWLKLAIVGPIASAPSVAAQPPWVALRNRVVGLYTQLGQST